MKYTHRFESVILHAMAVLLMVILGFVCFWLVVAFIEGIFTKGQFIQDTWALQASFQRAIAGVFVVLIGIEILETIRTYNSHRRFRLETVLIVGAIAVARHIIQLDFHHITGEFLLGLSLLVLSLVGGYWLLQQFDPPGVLSPEDSTQPEGEPAKEN